MDYIYPHVPSTVKLGLNVPLYLQALETAEHYTWVVNRRPVGSESETRNAIQEGLKSDFALQACEYRPNAGVYAVRIGNSKALWRPRRLRPPPPPPPAAAAPPARPGARRCAVWTSRAGWERVGPSGVPWGGRPRDRRGAVLELGYPARVMLNQTTRHWDILCSVHCGTVVWRRLFSCA
jgi:hypothetical protein